MLPNNITDPQWELSQFILGLNGNPVPELNPAGKLTATEALEVYQTGYHVRLVDTLRETYSAVEFCLGMETFKNIALEFGKKNPSRFYNLSHYGESFWRFLKDHDNLKEFPFVSELAQFEWEFCNLFHAPLDKADEINLNKMSGEDFSLHLVNHLRIFQCRYGIVNLWNGYSNADATLPDWKTPQNLVLYRVGSDIRLKELSIPEYFLIHFLMQSASISQSVNKLEGLGLEITESTVSALFAFLMAEGLIKSIA